MLWNDDGSNLAVRLNTDMNDTMLQSLTRPKPGATADAPTALLHMRAHTSLLVYAGLALVILLAVGGSAYWVSHNVVLVGRDAAGHLEQSILVAKALASKSWQGLFEATVLDEYRPPGLYLLTQPAYWLFGRTQQVALIPNIAMLGAVVVLTFVLARKVLDGWLALFAALLVSLLPMAAAMARLYYMETLLTTALLLALLALLKSDGFASRRWALAFGAGLGVMLLVKWTTPIYLLVPVLYVLWRHGFWRAQRHALQAPAVYWPRALLSLAAAAVLALLWYLPNRTYVHDQHMLLGDWLPLLWTLILAAAFYALSLRRSSRIANFWSALLLALAVASIWYLPRIGFLGRLSDVAFGTDRGQQEAWDPLQLSLYTRYLGFWITDHMGPLAAALILPVAFVGWLFLVKKARPNWRTVWRSAPEPLVVYGLLFASSWVFLTLLAQANPRNLTPLVPIAAILLALSFQAFARPLAVGIAAVWIAVLGLQWVMYTVTTVDQPLGAELYARTPQLWASGDYLQFPAAGSTDPSYWIHPRVLAAIGEPTDGGDADSLGILVNTWEVNRGAFRYLAERNAQTVKIMTLTEAHNRGWSDALANRWLLVKDGDNSNVAAPGRAVIDGIEHDDARGHELFHQLYTPVAVYPLPDGDTATLYFRAAGPRQPQDYPVILNETAPVAQNLNAWWSPGANVVFDSGDTAVWVGLHNLRADKVVIPQTDSKTGLAPLRDLQGTILAIARNDTTMRAALAENSYLAKTLQSGDTTLDIYGRPSRPLDPLPVAAPWSEVEFSDVRGLRAVQQGEVLPLEFHVKNLAGRPLKLSLRLLDTQGHVVAQNDVPAESEEPVRLGLFVPPGVAPGNYQLAAVLYEPDTLAPVHTRWGADAAALTAVAVTRAAAAADQAQLLASLGIGAGYMLP